MAFSLNGELLQDSLGSSVAFEGLTRDPLVPAITLAEGQKATFNFGRSEVCTKYLAPSFLSLFTPCAPHLPPSPPLLSLPALLFPSLPCVLCLSLPSRLTPSLLRRPYTWTTCQWATRLCAGQENVPWFSIMCTGIQDRPAQLSCLGGSVGRASA